MPPSIVCIAKQRELDDRRESVEHFVDRDLVAFSNGSKWEQFLTSFSYVDNPEVSVSNGMGNKVRAVQTNWENVCD